MNERIKSNKLHCIFLMTVTWYAPIDICLHWFWLQDNSIKTETIFVLDSSFFSLTLFSLSLSTGFSYFFNWISNYNEYPFYLSPCHTVSLSAMFHKRIEAQYFHVSSFCLCIFGERAFVCMWECVLVDGCRHCSLVVLIINIAIENVAQCFSVHQVVWEWLVIQTIEFALIFQRVFEVNKK